MLVLSRRATDSVVIHGADGDIVISILSVEKNGSVRLGIDAPQACKILRGELIAEVRDENKHAVANIDAAAALSQFTPFLSSRQTEKDSLASADASTADQSPSSNNTRSGLSLTTSKKSQKKHKRP